MTAMVLQMILIFMKYIFSLFLIHCRNCIQGFRKVDADKWEFANEGFLRGKRHLLRNIQRRKSPQAQGSSSGSSTEAGKTAFEGEIEKLKQEKQSMMQEVIELQQQQRGTVQHMRAVNEKLQAAEQRQKQMVSFLAKVFQNPSFLARLKQKNIDSPRTMRKFVKHHQHQEGTSGLSIEGEIVKYEADMENLATPSVTPDLNPLSVEQIPGNLGLGSESMPFKTENTETEALAMAHEDILSKGKNVVSTQPEVIPEYFISFPEESVKEENFPDLFSPGIENWSMGFEASPSMPGSSNELWGNLSNYDVPELGVSEGLSDIWELGSPQAAGGSPFNELKPSEPT